jgi:LacI family transcriptional regulator
MYAGNPEVHTHAQERLRGLAAGAGPDACIELFTTESVTLASGAAVGREIASRPPRRRPEALFCANDLVAIGAMQVLLREHVAIPDEVAVVGYDDIEFAAQVTVPLTTIRQPAYELGRQAAELLLADIDAGVPEHATHVSHVPTLVVRESTRIS